MAWNEVLSMRRSARIGAVSRLPAPISGQTLRLLPCLPQITAEILSYRTERLDGHVVDEIVVVVITIGRCSLLSW